MSVNYKPFVYGIVHALIDAATVGLLFGAITLHGFDPEKIYFMVLLYNALAFGLQPVVGIITDFLKKPKIILFCGMFLVLLSFCFFRSFPDLAIVLAALGNAFFHIGAGVISFFFTPKRATGPGIFVAPGALGLGAGMLLGKNGLFSILPFSILLFIAGIAIFFIKIPPTYSQREKIKIEAKFPLVAIGIFIISIFARSLIGNTAGYSLEKSLVVLVFLSLAACAGKALGGIIADKWGWLKTAVAALLISCPLVVFTNGNLVLGAAGIIFFQMAMPITLTATAGIMNRTPGLAFGLNCLALFLGLLIDFFPTKYFFYNPLILAISIVFTVFILFIGLSLLTGRIKKGEENQQNKAQ